MKTCPKCGVSKPFDNFYINRSARSGYNSYCKECDKKRLKERHQKTYNSIFPKKIVDNKVHCRRCDQYLDKEHFGFNKTYCKECMIALGHIGNLKKYGLSRDDYVVMEFEQNGVCKICGNEEKHNKRLSVDHDHSCCEGQVSCGKCIRGLLCNQCNKTLGLVKDDVQRLQAMIDYLTTYE
jgi:hypothetical protein